jgi:DivIVA domain-containing protein
MGPTAARHGALETLILAGAGRDEARETANAESFERGQIEDGRRVRQRRRVSANFRNVSFPIAVRGYERQSVDAYVARVNRVIAELEATHSPEAAIRHALHQAEQQTRGTLERARDEAQEITARARRQAGEIVEQAKAEAADIVVNASTQADRTKLQGEVDGAKAKAEGDEQLAKAKADAENILAEARKEADESLRRSQEEVAAVREKAEAWACEFSADTEVIRKERSDLLDDVRELAARLADAVSLAAERLPAEQEHDTPAR